MTWGRGIVALVPQTQKNVVAAAPNTAAVRVCYYTGIHTAWLLVGCAAAIII
jgi:hypothetical protein